METFVDHAEHCSSCRHEYELESAIKALVQTRVKIVRTPPALTESIVTRIHQVGRERSPAMSDQPPARNIAFPMVRPMVGVGLAFALAVAVMFWPFGSGSAPTSPGGNDVQTESISNFHAVLAGVMRPQVVSDRPEQIRAFLSGRTDFPVQVPALKKCTLVGASANEYHGMKLAHVVYTHAGQLIYMFQVPYDRVIAGEGLAISNEARQQLTRAPSYSSVAPGGDTVILWVLGNTLCVVVSKVGREELSSTLLQ
jgi:hypothetical protein